MNTKFLVLRRRKEKKEKNKFCGKYSQKKVCKGVDELKKKEKSDKKIDKLICYD